eukprot:RCo039203
MPIESPFGLESGLEVECVGVDGVRRVNDGATDDSGGAAPPLELPPLRPRAGLSFRLRSKSRMQLARYSSSARMKWASTVELPAAEAWPPGPLRVGLGASSLSGLLPPIPGPVLDCPPILQQCDSYIHTQADKPGEKM